MRTRNARLAWLLGAALFAYYLLILGGHHYSIDGIVMFESAKQLFFRQSLALDPPVTWGDRVFRVNSFSVGLMLAYLPALALTSPLFYRMPSLQLTPYDPALAHNPALYGNLAYLLCAWVNPLITALTGSLVFVIARRLGLTPGWAVIATLVYGVASPAAPYARYDFSQPLAGLALTATVWALIEAARDQRLRWLVGAGSALGGMLLTRPDLGVLIAWIGAWLAAGSRRSGWRAAAVRLFAVAVTVAIGLAFYLWANHARFGDWRRTGHGSLTHLFFARAVMRHPGISSPVAGALGLLASPSHGVLIFCPVAWLALPGLVLLARERHPAGTLWAGVLASALMLYAPLYMWWGGWSWGPRFLVPVVPALVLAATFWAFRAWARGARWRTRLFAGLAVLGFVIAWNGIVFDFVLYYRWVEKTMYLPETAATRFVLAASPLVSGWRFLRTTPVDLLLLRMGEFAGWPGTVAAALIAACLLGCLVWTGRRIRATLREEAARQ